MTEKRFALFMKYVRKTNDCWIWTGHVGSRGYGRVTIKRKDYTVHRAMYEHVHGQIPEGHHIHHRCHNPLCVNPEHLESILPHQHGELPGHGAHYARQKTHCPQGHPLSGHNIRWLNRKTKRGTTTKIRSCRTCFNAYNKRWRKANPDKTKAIQQRTDAKRRKTHTD